MATPVGQVFDFEVNDSSLVGLLLKVNEFTDVGQGGALGILFLIVISGALFFIMRSYGNERAFPVAMFVGSIVGVFLRILGFIDDRVFWICIALFVVSVIMLLREQGQFEG